MLIAAECEKQEGLHINSDNLFVEVINNGQFVNPGEAGELVITDLNNFSMPFVRYKNEDLAAISDKKCSCGRGLPLLAYVEGRILDAIQVPGGRVLPGEFFPHFFKDFKWIIVF